MFKIISVGWQCEPFIEQTLQSVENQSRTDWDMVIVYDHSHDDGHETISKWVWKHLASEYRCQFNEDRRGPVRNQVEGIKLLQPEDDDIIVFLDLDGDQLAHPSVLDRLAAAYADDTLLTYGNYCPVPFSTTCPPAEPFPIDVVHSRAYRQHVLSGKGCCFNHLRTMKGKVFKAIPEDRFFWPDSDKWYENGTDYNFMINGLELADGRYKCLEEVLLLYNHANPHADYLAHPAETHRDVASALARPPLEPLPR